MKRQLLRSPLARIIALLLVMIIPIDAAAQSTIWARLKFWDHKSPTVIVIRNERQYAVDVFVNADRIVEKLPSGASVRITFPDVYGEYESRWPPYGWEVRVTIAVGFLAPDGSYVRQRDRESIPIAKARYVKSRTFKLKEIR